MLVYYICQKGSASRLDIKSAGVTPEANLEESIVDRSGSKQARDSPSDPGSALTKCPKQGYQRSYKKNLLSQEKREWRSLVTI